MHTPPVSHLPPEQGAPALPVEAGARLETPAKTASKNAFQRRLDLAPEWFCAFLAGNTREKDRFRSELATMRGSVVWLVRQRRLGAWTATEREHLRSVMRSASSVSPYLIIWVVPGSLLVLPFMAWFIDRRRRRTRPTLLVDTAAPQSVPLTDSLPSAGTDCGNPQAASLT